MRVALVLEEVSCQRGRLIWCRVCTFFYPAASREGEGGGVTQQHTTQQRQQHGNGQETMTHTQKM